MKQPSTHTKFVDRAGSRRASRGGRKVGAYDVDRRERGQGDGDDDEQNERRDEEENTDSPVQTGHLGGNALNPLVNGSSLWALVA